MADDKKDICLTPETYVLLQNEAKNGMISVFVGPCLVNQTGQDKPVVYDSTTRRYRQVSTLEAAVQYFCRAEEGDYVILENPAEKDQFPVESQQQTTVPLQRGRKIVVPGPWSKPLWPGQSARVVPGHRLRSNQYLIVTIYNEEEAKKNWSRAIAKPASTAATETEGKLTVVETPTVKEFAVGQRFIVKGTDYSFYIPPTGVEVEVDEEGNYVRSAVTLEQLEYTILVDESGKKRYPQGPDVVFPEPNEQFVPNADGKRKFRAIELIAGSGILVKVIQPYTENGISYTEGQEVFITAEQTPIYRPREEHSVINYDGQNAIHFSTCVPKGEGRYVMDKMKGEIKLVHGPNMLLPDPRTEVMVRRVLTDDQCGLWYPGNTAALQYNRNLRPAEGSGTRSGFVSESAYQNLSQSAIQMADVSGTAQATRSFAASLPLPTRESAGSAYMEKFVRPSTYTPPRQITLDTRFDGVPSIKLYTGYAAMIVDKNGNRRVEVGPTNILLEYDESLEILELSRGKPKTTDNLLRTVYLRVANNKISDTVDIETADHVTCQIKFSYCVNFEGDPNKWFEVENYVKYLCDHARSVMKGMAKKYTVEELYQNYLNIIRDCILGTKPEGGKRTGMLFPENGMRITDVEVLGFCLTNQEIAQMLATAQTAVVQQNIEIDKAKKSLETLKKNEEIKVEIAEARAATREREQELQRDDIERALRISLANINAAVQIAEDTLVQEQKNQAIEWFRVQETLKRSKAQTDQQQAVQEAKAALEIKTLDAQTQAVVNRIVAAKEGFSEALVALGREEVLVKVAEASRIEGFISGDSTEATIGRIVGGLPIFQQIMERMSLGNGNGTKLGGRLSQPAPSIK